MVLPDGRQLLVYTGVLKEHQGRDLYREVQTQCMAVGDGMDYEKYEQNPVLDERDIPEGSSRFDFRDPKMWKAADGTLCLIGDYDEETGTFKEMQNQSIDYGIDFYATQTVLVPDGISCFADGIANIDVVKYELE